MTKRFTFNSSLPLFIILTLVLLIAFVAVFRFSDSNPYSIPKKLDIKEDDRLSIFDPQTEKEIDLAGFGDENIQVFFSLLE